MLKHAGIFEHAKRKNRKWKETPLFTLLKKVPFSLKPADISVITRGAGGQAPIFTGQEKGNNKTK